MGGVGCVCMCVCVGGGYRCLILVTQEGTLAVLLLELIRLTEFL